MDGKNSGFLKSLCDLCRTTHTLEVQAQSQHDSILLITADKGTGHKDLSTSDNTAGEKGSKIPQEITQCTEVGNTATDLLVVSDSEFVSDSEPIALLGAGDGVWPVYCYGTGTSLRWSCLLVSARVCTRGSEYLRGTVCPDACNKLSTTTCTVWEHYSSWQLSIIPFCGNIISVVGTRSAMNQCTFFLCFQTSGNSRGFNRRDRSMCKGIAYSMGSPDVHTKVCLA